jgi:hypothetical protein
VAIEQSPPDHVFPLSTGIPSSGDRLRDVSGHQEASVSSTLARDWRREAHEGMEQLRKGQAVSTNRIITTLPMKVLSTSCWSTFATCFSICVLFLLSSGASYYWIACSVSGAAFVGDVCLTPACHHRPRVVQEPSSAGKRWLYTKRGFIAHAFFDSAASKLCTLARASRSTIRQPPGLLRIAVTAVATLSVGPLVV